MQSKQKTKLLGWGGIHRSNTVITFSIWQLGQEESKTILPKNIFLQNCTLLTDHLTITITLIYDNVIVKESNNLISY